MYPHSIQYLSIRIKGPVSDRTSSIFESQSDWQEQGKDTKSSENQKTVLKTETSFNFC